MIRDPNKLSIDARYESDVLSAGPDGELVYVAGEAGYQGDEVIVAKLDDGSWLFYEWVYGSCSGCDEWERANLDGEALHDVIRTQMHPVDAETFADWLVACRAAKASWLPGEDGHYVYTAKRGTLAQAIGGTWLETRGGG